MGLICVRFPSEAICGESKKIIFIVGALLSRHASAAELVLLASSLISFVSAGGCFFLDENAAPSPGYICSSGEKFKFVSRGNGGAVAGPWRERGGGCRGEMGRQFNPTCCF